MASRIKRWVLAIAIAIVFNLFINYGIATFHPGPEYDDYCTERGPRIPFPAEKLDCEEVPVSEELQNSCEVEKGYVDFVRDSNGCPLSAYCETCGREFDDARQKYNANVFIILVVVGVAVLAFGLFTKAASVSTGFMLGGLLSIIIGTLRYWDQLEDIFRFIILGVVLAALLWLGYKKVKE